MRLRIQHRLGIHDLTVHAKAALKGLRLNPGLLNRVRLFRCAQPFERCDGFFLKGRNWSDAGPDRLALDNHCARSALTQTTTKAGSVKIEVIAQNVEQRGRKV